ncbi:MAG: PhzF family phenazine biosynthesis protein [Candidatus Adiutrix sp.]|nr:PhzF family phenazine biosynthesis protein [Candidatus Adiutrix sp.]
MKYHVVDVFTDRLFGGNPAGVCLLDSWPADETLQSIAAENNLSETAFLVKRDGGYDLRWFTPTLEIDLCGHATMGGAFVLFEFVETAASDLRFSTLSGVLTVTRGEGDRLWMDFPAWPAEPAPNYPALAKAFGTGRFETYKAADIMAVLESEEEVRDLRPDFEALKEVEAEAGMPDNSFGVIITAPGRDCDFVSRYFAPNAGINEDPVTGRSHCLMVPYWSKRLGRTKMTARQLSRRGGLLWVEDVGGRVHIGGRVKLYLTGEIMID